MRRAAATIARFRSCCASGRSSSRVFAILLAVTGWLYTTTPTAFVPDEDQGFAIVSASLPEGTAIDVTHQVQRDLEDILFAQHEITDVFDVAGFSFTGSGSNKITMFIKLAPWGDRPGKDHVLSAVVQRVNYRLFSDFKMRHKDVFAAAFQPPSVPGLGFQAGFSYELEDRANQGIPALAAASGMLIGQAYAMKDSPVAAVYTTFRTDKPTILTDVDRAKASTLGVSLPSLFNTMQVYLGSVYVNDFDLNGKAYRVYVQADTPYRSQVSDLQKIFVRSQNPLFVNGQLATPPSIPLTALVNIKEVLVPPTITHFNLYRSVEISGGPAPGHGSGEALATMDKFAANLPPGFATEWSGISREQIEGGAQAAIIFGLGIVFVFLVLSAQYESFADPLIILLAVPLAILGAIGGNTRAACLRRRLRAGRVRDADRLGVEECDSDRRVCESAARTRRRRGGGGHPCRRDAAAADLDDVDRVRARRDAAGLRDRRRQRRTQLARHRGLRRDDPLDDPEPVRHAGALRADRRHGRPARFRPRKACRGEGWKRDD